MIPFHSKTRNQAINLLSTDPIKGLTQQEAEYRLKKYGKNKITHKKKISKLKIFLAQFKNPLIYILLVAIFISLIIKEYLDALVIAIIVLLNSILGFYQEYKAERALELLKKIASPTAKVIRNKKIRVIPAENLVPGDIIILETGEKVPADARLLKISNLKINESILTGESIPVTKTLNALPKDIEVQDRKNMVFAGTIVSYGRAMAVVTATGNKTEFGRIAFSLKDIKRDKTHLQKTLDNLTKNLGKLTIILIAVMILLGLLRNLSFVNSLMAAITLAVAVIPEGLPAVVTIALALGVQTMARNKALVRKLSAIETLGAVTLIASDKTGTMTTGEMTVTQIYANNELIHVTGKGYETVGLFKTFSSKYNPENLHKLMETAVLCNNAQLSSRTGDPTELALLVVAKKANLTTNFQRVQEFPFDSTNKYMVSLDSYKDKLNLHVKGAPEVILEKCKYVYNNGRIKVLTEREKEKILAMNERMAKSALRVLAFAYSKDKTANNLIFLGLMGMIDPPREEAKEAVKLCKKAGIKVIMITGDNPTTAQAIANELGIGTEVLTGKQLSDISQERLIHLVRQIDIFARVNPEHKVRILDALQKNNEIVAMTGDGINDAPALKKANVGIAMGISGTDVSKDSADMILLDDNFNSIVKAVKHGRRIFDNIKKFVKLLLSANLGELGIIMGSLIVGLPLPLLPLQILWINLITDSIPAIALSVDPAEKNIMSRPPRKPKEGILDGTKTFLILSAILMSISSILIFISELQNLEKARTMTLLTMILFELLLVFVVRSRTKTIFQTNLLKNRLLIVSVIIAILLQVVLIYTPLSTVFKLTSLTIYDWVKSLIYAIIPITILEVRKLFLKDETKNRKIKRK